MVGVMAVSLDLTLVVHLGVVNMRPEAEMVCEPHFRVPVSENY